jgi:hypothetical protein
MVPDTKRDVSFWVRNFESPPDEAPPIKMEVGIEDCLHIEFEYDKAKYHLKVGYVGAVSWRGFRERSSEGRGFSSCRVGSVGPGSGVLPHGPS